LSTIDRFLSIVRHGVDLNLHYCLKCLCRCNRIAAS